MSRYKILDKKGTGRAAVIVQKINTIQRNLSACENERWLERKAPEPTISELKVFPVQNNYWESISIQRPSPFWTREPGYILRFSRAWNIHMIRVLLAWRFQAERVMESCIKAPESCRGWEMCGRTRSPLLGPERPFCEAVQGRPQSDGDKVAMEHLPRKAVGEEQISLRKR